MEFYRIDATLQACTMEECRSGKQQYVAVLGSTEWQEQKESFDMGIDLELDPGEIYNTKAEVNYDSLTGTFCIPDRRDFSADWHSFSFALDEKGIVFIDDSGMVSRLLERIRLCKRWKFPSIERLFYDFLEQIIRGDLRLMEEYERELDGIEKKIRLGMAEAQINRVNDIRSDIRDLRIHYEQLIDLGQELEENENNFFREENLRYFHMFTNRIERLYDVAASLRDYTMQLGDQYRVQLDVKQNRIMTVLTVVSTIFMPLTLIVGWYGMNFKYMPELDYPYAYPIVIMVCLVLIVVSLIFFKKKKLL
ncbi:MAG: magnesium transporter CorA [Lachnospiraceae bacterium]|nr:magnesium transporter CorA [Lachnospiraceae bacterium]